MKIAGLIAFCWAAILIVVAEVRRELSDRTGRGPQRPLNETVLVYIPLVAAVVAAIVLTVLRFRAGA